jgi:hypothetical protein
LEALRSDEVQLLVGALISVATLLITAFTLVYVRRISAHTHRTDEKFEAALDVWTDKARAEINQKRSKAR